MELLERFVEETYKHLDSLPPEEFAKQFVMAARGPGGSRESMFIMLERLGHYDPQRKKAIKDEIAYFSTPEGNVGIDEDF